MNNDTNVHSMRLRSSKRKRGDIVNMPMKKPMKQKKRLRMSFNPGEVNDEQKKELKDGDRISLDLTMPLTAGTLSLTVQYTNYTNECIMYAHDL